MKTCDLYGRKIEAYTPTELEALRHHGKVARDLWLREWERQGQEDNGTCCMGKGLNVWFIGKGKRKPEELKITRCDWVQGNLSASRSVKPALDYLKEHGITAIYDDGVMD